MPEVRPQIVSVTYLTIPGRIRYVFDIPMLTEPLDTSAVFVRTNNVEFSGSFIEWIGDTDMYTGAASQGPNPGPSISNSNGVELLLLSADGIPADTWSDFPVTREP